MVLDLEKISRFKKLFSPYSLRPRSSHSALGFVLVVVYMEDIQRYSRNYLTLSLGCMVVQSERCFLCHAAGTNFFSLAVDNEDYTGYSDHSRLPTCILTHY